MLCCKTLDECALNNILDVDSVLCSISFPPLFLSLADCFSSRLSTPSHSFGSDVIHIVCALDSTHCRLGDATMMWN